MALNQDRRAAIVAQQFKKTLNSHGFSFQRRVWKEVEVGGPTEFGGWTTEAYEFPVSLRDRPTSIDLIIRHEEVACFLVVECKRANPALANWCFARGPYPRGPEKSLVYERIDTANKVTLREKDGDNHVFGVAMEVRTTVNGEAENGGRGAIDNAVAQAVRGCSALLDFGGNRLFEMWGASSHVLRIMPGDAVGVIPVVVTTAVLWTSEVDLETADLSTGNLPSQDTSVQQVPWVFYRFHMTPDLRSRFGPRSAPGNLRTILNRDYGRTVPIVNAVSLGKFLGAFRP